MTQGIRFHVSDSAIPAGWHAAIMFLVWGDLWGELVRLGACVI